MHNKEQNYNIEIWKELPNTNYMVSSKGRVKHKDKTNNECLNLWTDKDGYLRASLYNGIDKDCKSHTKGKYVHKLVAQCFLGEIPKGLHINHIDGDKTNNNIDNLEYVTLQENNYHRDYILYSRTKNIPRGVTFNKSKNKYQVVCGKGSKFVGRYNTKEEAYKAAYIHLYNDLGFKPWDDNIYHTFSHNGLEDIVNDGIDREVVIKEKIEEYKKSRKQKE